MNTRLSDIKVILYTPNGTDPTEIHWFNSTLNVRYFENVDLFHDFNNFFEYTEQDVTSWLSPNYISELQTWDPLLPSFILEHMYLIRLLESNPVNLTFIAFEDCRDAKFLFRVWYDIPSKNVTWKTPSWILFNETTGSFIVDTSKVTSIQHTNIVFQSQLIGLSFLNYFLNNTISTFSSSFNFTNKNWIVADSYSKWYVLYEQMTNFTMKFNDAEGDTVLLKIVNSDNLSLFIQRLNKSVFTLLATW